MATTNSIIRTASKISLGLVIVLVWGWMWIRADVLFPVNTETWKITYLLTFMGLVTFVFAWDTAKGSRTESDLFRVSFLKQFPKFLLSAGISLAILVGIGLTIKGDSINTISGALSQVSWGIIIVHALMISIGEELVFRGWVVERLKERRVNSNYILIISTIIFAVFHAGMGKSLITLLTYIPLGIIFFKIKEKYSPRSNMANAGAHFAWNLFILGFLIAV